MKNGKFLADYNKLYEFTHVDCLQYSTIVFIQNELNELTVTNWAQHLSIHDFETAMLVETAELLDSGRRWAWWKKPKQIDGWNEKIEFIDIYHFFVAKHMLLSLSRYGEIYRHVPTPDREFLIDAPIVNAYGDFNNVGLSQHVQRAVFDPDLGTALDSLEKIGFAIGIKDHREISVLYILKSYLNFIRQLGGYSTGEYQKVLNGRTDNEIIKEVYDDVMDNNIQLKYIAKKVRDIFGLN